jgi:hypothetical protein
LRTCNAGRPEAWHDVLTWCTPVWESPGIATSVTVARRELLIGPDPIRVWSKKKYAVLHDGG